MSLEFQTHFSNKSGWFEDLNIFQKLGLQGGWKLAAGVHFFVTAAKYHFFPFLQLNIEFAANGFLN